MPQPVGALSLSEHALSSRIIDQEVSFYALGLITARDILLLGDNEDLDYVIMQDLLQRREHRALISGGFLYINKYI